MKDDADQDDAVAVLSGVQVEESTGVSDHANSACERSAV